MDDIFILQEKKMKVEEEEMALLLA